MKTKGNPSFAASTQQRQLLAVILVLSFSISCIAQENTSIDTIRDLMNSGTVGARQDIEANLRDLEEATKRLKQGAQQIVASPNVDRRPDPNETRLYSSAPKPEQSVDDIRERIRLLRRLRNAQEKVGVTPTLRPVPTPSQAPELIQIEPRKDQPTLSAIEENIESEGADTPQPDANTEPSIQATQILPTPVNALELAQSLYQTKNYSAALKALKSLDQTGLSQSDLTWIELLKALCQRRLGEADTSEAILREIANEKATDYPVPVARWWLKQSEIKRETIPFVESTTVELDSLLERAQKHVQ